MEMKANLLCMVTFSFLLGQGLTDASDDNELQRLFSDKLNRSIPLEDFSLYFKYGVIPYRYDFTSASFFLYDIGGKLDGNCSTKRTEGKYVALSCDFNLSRSFALYSVEKKNTFWKSQYFVANASIVKGSLNVLVQLDSDSDTNKPSVACSVNVSELGLRLSTSHVAYSVALKKNSRNMLREI
ncbi:uncharacterized protein LOC125946127 [Dermacentor silvarum]|uniref:uncharacterized protein LOC125946127 n=1 Tax=Dermacentor silvarum TaxID=543639 RepID=UPI002100CD12|nr:uncharacterized protein LOC125946127 [Dermacentor silvarum]